MSKHTYNAATPVNKHTTTPPESSSSTSQTPLITSNPTTYGTLARNQLFSDPDGLPIYTATEAPPQNLALIDLNRLLTDSSRDTTKDIHLWQRFLDGYTSPEPDPAPGSEFESARLMDQGMILRRYFGAISDHQQDVVGLLVEKGLVTANSKFNGQTPLFKAVETRDVDLVLQLLHLGAEVDEFSALVPLPSPWMNFTANGSRNLIFRLYTHNTMRGLPQR